MLAYYKKYVILICAVSVAVPVVASTLYAMATGTMLAASLGGMLLSLALLFGTMMLMQSIVGRRANERTNALLDLYNQQCDPEAFIEQGRTLANAITVPFGTDGSWFLTYYGQALLDAGKADEARATLRSMQQSAEAARRSDVKAGILLNEAPLVAKLEGPQAALALVDEAYQLLGGDAANVDDQRIVFLKGQRKLLQAEVEGDDATLRQFYEKAQADASVPERLRVESAWKLARLSYRTGDAATERAMLRYVIDHGNKLALVAPACKQLQELG